MSILDAFGDWMRATVTLEAPAGAPDVYGQTVPGPARDVAAYIIGQQKLVRSFAGDERLSSVQVILAEALDDIGPQHRLTLPAPWRPTSPPLLGVERLVDDDGSVVSVLYA